MVSYKKDKKKLTEHRAFILNMQEKEKRSSARNIKVIIMPMSFLEKKPNDLFIVIYRPNNLQKPPYPTLFHIRGTGYNASARYYSYITCSHIAEKSDCQVIDLDHHLAPEYPFPQPFNDVYAAYKSIIFHAHFLQIDTNKIAISGYSSGGNLATLMTIQAKKDMLPVSLQILISPILDLSRSLKKFKKFENKDSFPDSLVDWFIELYLQNNFYSSFTPEISPFWSDYQLNFPPTYLLFGENDRFRSDSEVFYDKLNRLGFWAHKSVFENGNHSAYWRNMNVLEAISAQLKMGFNLIGIPRPNSFLFFNTPYPSKSKFFVKENNDNFITLNENQYALKR